VLEFGLVLKAGICLSVECSRRVSVFAVFQNVRGTWFEENMKKMSKKNSIRWVNHKKERDLASDIKLILLNY
jgi:hypothetical protein